MKQLLAATLLVTLFAVTGCGDAKKPAAKPATPAPADTKPMDKPADPAKAP
jgi:hypothetical protein